MSPSTPRIKFSPSDDFRATLQARVSNHLNDLGVSGSDDPRIYIKACLLISTLIASYTLLVFTDAPLWLKLVAAVIYGLAGAGIGFNVMHDAGHGSMSTNKRVNRFFFYSLDFLGASSYFWNIKHNQLHHTYTNINGYDDDIDVGSLMRLSPDQPRRAFHRFQHLYIWPLYGLIVVKWQLFDDFSTWRSGKITDQHISRPRGRDITALLLGKAWYLGITFIIPMMLYPPLIVIGFYLLALWVEGFVLAVTFQMAHCLEEAELPSRAGVIDNTLDRDWARHQVLTTVDFAPSNKLLTWYMGGLNYQVIHHLFPKISHVHYPEIAPIVEETCRDFGLTYKVHQSLWGAVRSHFRHLKTLSKLPAPSPPVSSMPT